MEQETLTVSQLNERVRRVILNGVPGTFWITGDLAKYDVDLPRARTRSYGQVYFELLEKDDSGGTVRSSVKAVLWGKEREAIESKLNATAGGLALRDGLQARLLCKADFYNSGFQLKVQDVDPGFTMGRLALDRATLLRKLAKEGLLGRNKAVGLSSIPLRIGLVTSLGSAAHHDFDDEIGASKYRFSIREENAQMQGAGTPSSVAKALGRLAARGGIDVAVIVRGGGGKADLIWFDHEEIARAIAAFPAPVIAGIGHEIDRSVADEVAYLSVKTPTAAAQFLIARVLESEGVADRIFRDIAAAFREKIREELSGLGGTKSRLSEASVGRLRGIRSSFEGAKSALRDRTRVTCGIQSERLSAAAGGLARETQHLLSYARNVTTRLVDELVPTALGAVQSERDAAARSADLVGATCRSLLRSLSSAQDGHSRTLEARHRERLGLARERLASAYALLSAASGMCRKHLRDLRPAIGVLTAIGKEVRGELDWIRVAFSTISMSARRSVGRDRSDVEASRKAVELLDPVNVLRRGYSLIVREDGSILTKAASALPGEAIKAVMQDGTLCADVREIEKGDRHEPQDRGTAAELRRGATGT